MTRKIFQRYFRRIVVTLATLGLILPLPAMQTTRADSPRTSSPQAGPAESAVPTAGQPSLPPSLQDLKLDRNGCLQGTLIDMQGCPRPGVVITAGRANQPALQVQTDRNGRFAFTGMQGGVYQFQVNGSARVCRVWTNQAAPPAAVDSVVMIYPDPTLRGQHPMSELFLADPVLLSLILAAAIAIPIAIQNSKSDHPSSS